MAKPSNKVRFNLSDVTGHTILTWDPSDPKEVQAAREAFESLKAKGYRAFKVGDALEEIVDFDAAVAHLEIRAGDEVTFVPEPQGGCTERPLASTGAPSRPWGR